MLKKISLLFICLSLFFTSEAKTLKIKKNDLKKLQKIISGEFNNETQSKADASFQHTILEIKPIWSDEINGYWFYVEQAMANNLNSPTLQNVYHLFKQNDTIIQCQIYEIKNPKQYIGAYKELNKISSLTIDSLIDNQGCSLYLKKRKNNIYSGSTPWRTCYNKSKKGAYNTSEIVIYKKKIVSWQREWNEKDVQVSGSIKGGYIFIKKK